MCVCCSTYYHKYYDTKVLSQHARVNYTLVVFTASKGFAKEQPATRKKWRQKNPHQKR